MAKRKTKSRSITKLKTKYNKKLMAAAGIFAAGSLVGAAVDFSSVPAYFEITAPSSVSISAETEPSAAEETVQTLSAETEKAYIPPETEKEEVPAPAPETTAAPLPEVVPETVPAPEPEIVPEPAPAPTPETVPEPKPKQEPDWMEAIFVPAEEPSAGTVSEPDDWMDTDWNSPAAEQTQTVPVTGEGSSMTEELAGMLENVAVFWAPSGGKIHLDPGCRSFETVRFAGTLEEAQTVRTEGWCQWCAEHLDGTDNTVFYVKGNIYATFDQLVGSYTCNDYLNGIPASAFGG